MHDTQNATRPSCMICASNIVFAHLSHLHDSLGLSYVDLSRVNASNLLVLECQKWGSNSHGKEKEKETKQKRIHTKKTDTRTSVGRRRGTFTYHLFIIPPLPASAFSSSFNIRISNTYHNLNSIIYFNFFSRSYTHTHTLLVSTQKGRPLETWWI